MRLLGPRWRRHLMRGFLGLYCVSTAGTEGECEDTGECAGSQVAGVEVLHCCHQSGKCWSQLSEAAGFCHH